MKPKKKKRTRSSYKASKLREYWSARPGNYGGPSVCKESKKRTHKAERREGKEIEDD